VNRTGTIIHLALSPRTAMCGARLYDSVNDASYLMSEVTCGACISNVVKLQNDGRLRGSLSVSEILENAV
jgi:hypothetical protein